MGGDVPKAVVFDASYTVDVHRTNAWTRIPVPAGVVLQEARMDGKEAPVVLRKCLPLGDKVFARFD